MGVWWGYVEGEGRSSHGEQYCLDGRGVRKGEVE